MKPSRWIMGLAGAALLLAVSAVRAGNGTIRNDEFTFVRVMYPGVRGFFFGGGGGSGYGLWDMDFSASDENITRILREQTALHMTDPQQVELTDPRLFEYPFIYMVEVGSLELPPNDVSTLREYLLRGGFLMVDDFHGDYEWARWAAEMAKVFPDRRIEDIPIDHPVFHCYYDFDTYPQVPGTAALFQGRTWEKGGRVPHGRGIFDDKRRLMVLINWNTDLGDGWEHAADPIYPRELSELAYRLGINFAVYAMTH